MNSDEVKALLASESLAERRRAAREIQKNPQIVDRRTLAKAVKRETVPVIRRALAESLAAKIEPSAAPADKRDEREAGALLDKSIREQLYSKAIAEVCSLLLHEVEPVLGAIELAASREIGDFDRSTTRTSIDRLKLHLDAITRLRASAQPPRWEEIDIAALVRNCAASDPESGKCQFHFAGSQPLIGLADPGLISIALSNGIRNAIEAYVAETDDDKPILTLNWGETNEEYWISVIDNGVGFVGSLSGIFDIGTTSKKGHLGMGLPMARQAMLSLGGEATLTPANRGGCRFHVRWPKLHG